MPVKHDLFQDLGISKEKAMAFKDPRLDALLKKYEEADKTVLEAEAGDALGVSDETLLNLKDKRLKVKDEIVNRLHELQESQKA